MYSIFFCIYRENLEDKSITKIIAHLSKTRVEKEKKTVGENKHGDASRLGK